MPPATRRMLPYAAAGAAVIALAAGAYSCTRGDHSDRLSDAEAGIAQPGADNLAAEAEAAEPVDPAIRCGSAAAGAALKRELFRRAAQIRGKDSEMLERIAAAAALRVDRPVVTSRDEGLGSIACAASAALDLPPGLAVAGGRTSLGAELGYSLEPAADGSGDTVVLTNAEAMVVPLATVAQVAPPPPEPRAGPEPAERDPLAAADSPEPDDLTGNIFDER